MVPVVLMQLAELPLSANGKLSGIARKNIHKSFQATANNPDRNRLIICQSNAHHDELSDISINYSSWSLTRSATGLAALTSTQAR